MLLISWLSAKRTWDFFDQTNNKPLSQVLWMHNAIRPLICELSSTERKDIHVNVMQYNWLWFKWTFNKCQVEMRIFFEILTEISITIVIDVGLLRMRGSHDLILCDCPKWSFGCVSTHGTFQIIRKNPQRDKQVHKDLASSRCFFFPASNFLFRSDVLHFFEVRSIRNADRKSDNSYAYLTRIWFACASIINCRINR